MTDTPQAASAVQTPGPGMMTDLNGNIVPVPQGSTIKPIQSAPSTPPPGMMTDLQGNIVPIPQGATVKPLPSANAATPDFSVKQALTGPGTVGGIIQGQDAGSATETRFEGVAKLGSAITEAYHNAGEEFAHHIMPGSPAEALIQKINPSFKATAPVAYADATMRNSMNMPFASNPLAPTPGKTDITNAPVADVAQFIDKKTHPVSKALAEAAQSFTSPTNVAILASTGGFGLVESPTALATANRLLSAGFTAQAIGAAYENSQSFKKAYDAGDGPEALYQMTHLVTNGVTAVMAGAHAAGHELPLASATDKAVAGKVGELAGKAVAPVASTVESAGDLINKGRNRVAEEIVGPLVKKSLSETAKDEKFNREPAQAILDEGLVGTKSELVTKADARISELGKGVDHVLQNHPNSNNIINAEPVIDSAIKDAQESAEKVGDANKVQMLENLKTALKTKFGPMEGTPFEMNELKRDVGDVGSEIGAFKSTDPIEASRAAVLGDVYRGIKELVNEQVPEVKDLNDRISNLVSAKTGLQRNINLQTNKPFIDSHMTLLGTGAKIFENTITSAPVRTWLAQKIKSGETLSPPEKTAAPNSGGAGNPKSGAEPTAQAPAKVETVPPGDKALAEEHPAAQAYHAGDYAKAFDEGIRNHEGEDESEIELIEPKIRTNASGESAASQEAINRLQGEKAQGKTYVRIDTRHAPGSAGRETKIPSGVDAVDTKPSLYEKIVLRQPGRPDVVLDRGSKARD